MLNEDSVIQYNKEIVEKIFESKAARRKELASLPIEEKIKILVEMQKIVLGIRKKVDPDDTRQVWQI